MINYLLNNLSNKIFTIYPVIAPIIVIIIDETIISIDGKYDGRFSVNLLICDAAPPAPPKSGKIFFIDLVKIIH